MIQLDRHRVRASPPSVLDDAIRQIVRSVKFEFVPSACAIRLLGPDMRYHDIDDGLLAALQDLRPGMGKSEILAYRASRPRFDLCLEDSWSGCFIAEHLRERDGGEDLVLIHADDHTDMMDTLLTHWNDGLVDPATGDAFDPDRPEGWASAIQSGSVGIGSFVTPLFHSKRKVHVRHINNATTKALVHREIHLQRLRYPLIPDLEFAGVGSDREGAAPAVGSYVGGACPDAVLRNLPTGCVIAHIDLDWFINDFNGNASQAHRVADPAAIALAQQKMDRLFAAFERVASRIERWIVATSPGFCAAAHWAWLLEKIDRGIEGVAGR